MHLHLLVHWWLTCMQETWVAWMSHRAVPLDWTAMLRIRFCPGETGMNTKNMCI